MEGEYITRQEHEAFSELMKAENQRLYDEDSRQNKRLEKIENSIEELFKIASNIERLAVSMENMVKEQEAQGKRLEVLEGRDGEKWRSVASHILTILIGAVAALVLSKIGL